ncbi:ABC transporter substrate-binding protein [Brevibacillus centrosporus]|uniref:Putative ABC transport system substrate-binding protein n=1 Tax=Brevibacillus centrosporus TaxID=54910 RepID=A0A1I3SCY3_9BACL|nr:ABC transporter substrate-binding protein [Brevibacillus centrosporus]MEC2131887.1 ABC transporter substrate-binding protein [Brevibacillus centrosporus]MED1951875.1 ABC transporter substrate-binding protein [Brevibacillus centrosporus]RNB64006.1 ABC transporter substrate-binding protein [Brevibacillus centrosporus]SFJ55366.1 putative ABC transport system substrate-binding protein [Brevibacillus centrosporus]GED34209.1 ABC transporter substrate-binding protein [Brevibacillus centrosporus]
MFKQKKTVKMMKSFLFPLLLLSVTACGQQSATPANNQSTTPAASTQEAPAADKQLTIGISQFVEHPALDAAREGFVAQLAKNGYEDGKQIKIDLKSAQASMDTAISIAQKFEADKVDLVLAIATPTAQAAAQTSKEIPILFTAVTDPVEAGLVKSMEKPEGNVTGTSDMNPVEEQLKLIKEMKADAKTVGIIYSSGEVNSKVQVDAAKAVADKLGLTIQEAAITSATEVKQAAESMVGKVDAYYIPTDNMVVSSIAAVLGVAESQKIPVIAGEENSVKSGAIATYGIDYTKLGAQTADMAVKILKGEAKPGDMPVEMQADMKLVLNKKAAEKMGVTIPQAMLDRAGEVVE